MESTITRSGWTEYQDNVTEWDIGLWCFSVAWYPISNYCHSLISHWVRYWDKAPCGVVPLWCRAIIYQLEVGADTGKVVWYLLFLGHKTPNKQHFYISLWFLPGERTEQMTLSLHDLQLFWTRPDVCGRIRTFVDLSQFATWPPVWLGCIRKYGPLPTSF